MRGQISAYFAGAAPLDVTLWERLLFEPLPLLHPGDYGVQLFLHPVPLFLDFPAMDHQRSHTHSRRSNQEQGSDKGKQIKEAQSSYQVDEDKKSKNNCHGLHRAHSSRKACLCFCSVGSLLNVV